MVAETVRHWDAAQLARQLRAAENRMLGISVDIDIGKNENDKAM